MMLAAVVFAGEAGVVPVEREPEHHSVLDNEFLHVFDVVVPPHEATLAHRHDLDYVFITLGDSDISNERVNEKPVHVVLKDGETRYTRGGFAHVARNLAETPFHNITIELKNPGAAVCGVDPSSPCESGAGSAREVFSTERVVARLVTLEPGQETPVHTHASPHLAIAVDDLAFENHPDGKPSSTFSMKKGEFVWVGEAGITHFFKNVGSSRARMLSLEFK